MTSLANNSDPRSKKTLQNIKDAFHSLVCEKDADKITVSEITKIAGINRKTFYLHYTYLEELFRECCEEIVAGYCRRMDSFNEEYRYLINDKARYEFSYMFLDYFLGAPEYVKHLICNPSYHYYLDLITLGCAHRNRQMRDILATMEPDEQKFFNAFFVECMFDFIRKYYKFHMDTSLEKISQYALKLIFHGMSSYLDSEYAAD